MNLRRLLTVSWLLLLPSVSGSQQWDSASAVQVAPGVTHRRVVVNSGPWRINVLEVDLRQPGIVIRGMKGKDSFAERETVSSMVARYKGPGVVLGAVNADFFNVKTGESENNVVIEGDVSKGVTLTDSPYDKFDNLHSQFGVDWRNHPYIERFGLAGTLRSGSHQVQLNGINSRPSYGNTVVLYTRAIGDSSPVDTVRHDLVHVPLRLVSHRLNEMTFRVAGPVHTGGRASLAGGGALSAEQGSAEKIRAISRRGGLLRVTAGMRPGSATMRTVVGGWPRIVRDGKSSAEYSDIVEGTAPGFSAGRHPRTAIGISKDGTILYLMTVDGRRESDGGMSLVELAGVMMQLGAYNAMNFDGGGSTTMVVGGEVVNRPSDKTGERPVGSALLVIGSVAPTTRQ